MTIMFKNRPSWLYKGSTWNDESEQFNGWSRAMCYGIFKASAKGFKNEPTEKDYTPDCICGTWIH